MLSSCFYFFSLLREHTLDGSGWAPTRKLKVGFRGVFLEVRQVKTQNHLIICRKLTQLELNLVSVA